MGFIASMDESLFHRRDSSSQPVFWTAPKGAEPSRANGRARRLGITLLRVYALRRAFSTQLSSAY